MPCEDREPTGLKVVEVVNRCTEWSPLAPGQPLFDWCGAPVDQRMLQALQNCLCCLGHLKTVLHVLLNQSTPLTDQGELLLGSRTLLTWRTGFAWDAWDSVAGVVNLSETCCGWWWILSTATCATGLVCHTLRQTNPDQGKLCGLHSLHEFTQNLDMLLWSRLILEIYLKCFKGSWFSQIKVSLVTCTTGWVYLTQNQLDIFFSPHLSQVEVSLVTCTTGHIYLTWNMIYMLSWYWKSAWRALRIDTPVQSKRVSALGKAHISVSTQSLRSFPNITFETVPVFVRLTMALSGPFKEDRLALPPSTPLHCHSRFLHDEVELYLLECWLFLMNGLPDGQFISGPLCCEQKMSPVWNWLAGTLGSLLVRCQPQNPYLSQIA